MAMKDDVYVIDDENILSVEGRDQTRKKSRGAPADLRHHAFDTMGAAAHVRSAPRAGAWLPATSATLSLLVCGAGQALNGQRQLGLLFFLVELLVATIHWSVASMWGFLLEMGSLFEVGERQMLAALAGIDALFLIFVLANVGQAWRRASISVGGAGSFGNPILSVLASAVMPGAGQLCNAQPGKALFFFAWLGGTALATASIFLDPFASWFQEVNMIGRISEQGAQVIAGAVFLMGALWVLNVYDAFIVSRYRRGA